MVHNFPSYHLNVVLISVLLYRVNINVLANAFIVFDFLLF